MVESAWFFNCGVYAKLKEEGEQKVHTRVMFDINDDLDKKIKKRLGIHQSDDNDGYSTDSEHEDVV